MSKILVVVYSWSGTSRRLAELLAASQQWTLADIDDAERGRTHWRCALDSLLQRRPTIHYAGPDPRQFDAVVLVSPIWVARLPGPMRSFIAERASALRHVAVISVMSGRGASGALVEISRLLQRAPIFEAAFTRREVEEGSGTARLQAFGTAVRQAVDRIVERAPPGDLGATRGAREAA